MFGDGMNSQLKDALNEFIDRNSAAIEQAMENTNHAKGEPLIQDLVNYLSGTKDNQATSMEDRSCLQHSLSCESNLDLTQFTHVKSPLPKSKSEDVLSHVGHVSAVGRETSSTVDTNLHLLMPDQEHPQYQQHHDSYGQNISVFPYSGTQSTHPDNIPDGNSSSSTFDRPGDDQSNEVSSLLASSDSHYDHSEDPVQLHFASDAVRQYSHTQSTQFPNTPSDTGQFQKVSEMCSNGFQDSSVLSSFTSASSMTPYSTTLDSSGFVLMDVTLASVNTEISRSQIKVPESMQTDEAEVIFKQAVVPTNGGQFQTAQLQNIDQHLQVYSSSSFNLFSSLDNAQGSSPTSNGLSCGDFDQNLIEAAESHSSAVSQGAPVTAHATATFDLSVNSSESSLSGHVNTFESSLSGPNTSQNFQGDISEPTPSAVLGSVANLQGQPSPCQVNSVNSDTTDSAQYSDGRFSVPDNTEFSVPSTPSSACFNHDSDYLSPYQSNQFQDSPHSHSPLNISDALKISIMNCTSPIPGLSPNPQRYQRLDSTSYQHPHSSHQLSPVNCDQYQRNPTAGSNYASNPTVVRSPDQQIKAYESETASSMNISAPFPATATTVVPHQQQVYSDNSSAQANESSYFLKCSSDTSNLASLNQICSPQNMTEYTSLDSSNQLEPLTYSNNSASDVTMRELPVEGHEHSFSHLDFQSMVNNFDAQGGSTAAPQNNCNVTSSLMFSQQPNPVVESNAHLNLNDQGQSVERMASFELSSSVTSLASGQYGQPTESQFRSSTFEQLSTSQIADPHFTCQMSMKNFPQPMQVQDSEFLNPSAAAREKANISIETSMDTSSDLGEHPDRVSHRISFEEIHMSIVNAGHRLSQELCTTNVEQTSLYKSTNLLVGKTEPEGCFSDMQSFRDLQTFHIEASKIGETVCNNDPRLLSAISASESLSLQTSQNELLSGRLNGDSNTTYNSTSSSSAPNVFTNLNTDHNLLANMLSNSQTPAESHRLHLENPLTNQPAVTVPNFLQNPVSGNSVGSQDHHILMPSKNVAENLHHFVVTTTPAPPFNSGTAISSSANQLSGNSMGTPGAAVNLLQYFSSLSQSRTDLVENTSENGANLRTIDDNRAVSMNLAETSVFEAASASETSLQSASFVTASKTSTYSNTLKDTVVLEADEVQGSAGNLNGSISLGVSTSHSSTMGNAESGTADATNDEPQIIMSLEDLQQLILEQKSHSSTPVLHHLSHGAASSPQTLVIQKHASHSLRQTQSRLTAKGTTLSNTCHVLNPHHQVLHANDGTQFLLDRNQHSERILETEAKPQRHSERAVIFADQESSHKLSNNSFHIPVISQNDLNHAHSKPMEQYSQPKPIEQDLQPKLMQHQQQTINSFLKEDQNPQNPASQQHRLVLLPGNQQVHSDPTYIQSEPTSRHFQNLFQPVLKQEEQKQLQKQEKEQHWDGQQNKSFFLQFKDHFQSMEQPERHDRPCNDSLKSEYKHLHSLLVGESAAVSSQTVNNSGKAPHSFFKTKESDVDMDSTVSPPHSTSVLKVEDPSPAYSDSHVNGSCHRQASLLAQILTERKRCHSPLSVSLHSPANSDSEHGSPLSSPALDDGNTQLTLIERSAGLQIRSDHQHSIDDGSHDDDENAIFDLNAFHKRPSADELSSDRDTNVNVPMKIAKPSVNADAHTSVNPLPSPEPKFDFGGALSSASSFSFAFGNKEISSPGMFTFGSSGTVLHSTDSQQYKDGSNPNRPSCSKPIAKAVGMRSAVPTQPVRPTSRKQKEQSLKASFPSKVDGVELKILAQPESQHRARYQTEGSRGAIKDESQQGYPVIKLCGYSLATKLQVYIGDEGGKAKPHGFYQACRVSGKNSTQCTEQEIEGTVVLEVDILPENNMTVKLDCIGILKLRNADVEGRIGPKRARDKKKTNTRARLVMRCSIEKSDGRQYFVQVASNPIVCTQPVGQPEISRMSLTECSVTGGDSLFIIGKNFRNKGTTVLFQTLDSTDDYVTWQAEAQIEQEYFQPTHLICKIPPYKDRTIKNLQEAQIVVSCAGKMSDAHSFIYKPVYHMVSPMKQEIQMETDPSVSARTLPFVSPEALHLNRMVQQTHAQSSANSMFQLPANTLPDLQGATVKSPRAAAFKGLRPAVLTNLTLKPDVAPKAESSTSASVLATSVSFTSGSTKNIPAGTLSQLPQNSSVFGDKYNCNGLVQRSSSQPVMSLPVSDTITNGTAVSSMVLSNKNTHLTAAVHPALKMSHPALSLVSASTAGHTDQSSTVADLLSTGTGPTVSHKELSSTDAGATVSHENVPSPVATSVPSSPFFLVVDPAVFQGSTGGDRIQQLLLQILEAQSKLS